MQSYHLGALLAVLSLASMVVSLEDQQVMFLAHSSDKLYLTRDELGTLIGEFKHIEDIDEELLDEYMARADQDGDGKVNREEFEEVMLLLRTDLLL